MSSGTDSGEGPVTYSWSVWDCEDLDGVCRESFSGPVCVRDQPCGRANGACIDNRLHGCQGGFLTLESTTCSEGTVCMMVPRLNIAGEPSGDTLAFCAFDTTPCTGNATMECRGNRLVRCLNGYPRSVDRVCPDDHPCTQSGLTAACMN